MTDLIAQYIAGALILIALFLLLSDPQGTSTIISSISSFNTSAIGALQGQGGPGYRQATR